MSGIDKLETGIPGFDYVADGGLPIGGTTLVSGTAGSAKTVFAMHFLAEGIRRGERGVFVTFEEPPENVRRNSEGLGWEIAQWERDGLWRFVDVSPEPSDDSLVAGDFDLGALLARIERAVTSIGAKRLAMDSLGAIFSQLADGVALRKEIFRVMAGIRELGVTAIVTAERRSNRADADYGVEEFVADNVVLLRNTLEEERRRRTLEILKFRGASHRKGEFPFTVASGRGFVVIPLSALELGQESSNVRIGSGNADLDAMCGGGFFRDSVVLLSGATGTGKTLLATQFVAGAVGRGERALLFAFEESRAQLYRNAAAWGLDFGRLEREGKLRVLCAYPESDTLEDHLIRMKQAIDDFKPQRLAVDSLSALARVGTVRGFREFAIALTAFIKHREVAGLFTSTTTALAGTDPVADPHVATITDAIVLLRYLERAGTMHRGIAVLKMRGSAHDREVREFTIDGAGLRIGKPYGETTRMLGGALAQPAAMDGGHDRA